MITAEVRRLYEMLWYPGRTMHASWWRSLDMEVWQRVYAVSEFCRSQIDELIRKRASLCEYSVQAKQGDVALMLMSPGKRISSIVVALGILATGRSEYLLLTSYRRELGSHLSERNCDDLLAVSPAKVRPIDDVPEASIVALCEQLGMRWIDRDMRDEAAWRGLRLQLPAPDKSRSELGGRQEPVIPQDNVLPSLVRLGRLL
ncbi:type III secretion system domain-containing protein [Paraburkholderia sediminicola]|uniref:type III secretion system domain-containing protein n=1 Tax=Paraburkholderia sediminicola TaxID=458836 RepID=UPI0038B710B1